MSMPDCAEPGGSYGSVFSVNSVTNVASAFNYINKLSTDASSLRVLPSDSSQQRADAICGVCHVSRA